MLTQTAKNDLAALRQQGFKPTDEEIVALNDLAVRIERGRDTTPANMPRIGFAGNIVLHEPTIGAIEWWHNFGRDSTNIDELRLMTYFFCLAFARNIEYLEKLTEPAIIRKEVKKWQATISATIDELWRAMMWVKCGVEIPELKERVDNTINDEDSMNRLWTTVIAAAGALNKTPDQLKTSTVSDLVASLVQANLHARIPMKPSVAKDYIAYKEILRRIEDRGAKENG